MSQQRSDKPSSSKNPYEIRLDVLNLAAQLLESNRRSQETVYRETSDPRNAPKNYSADDLIATANSLYSFISDKSGSVGSSLQYTTAQQGLSSIPSDLDKQDTEAFRKQEKYKGAQG